MSKLLFNNSIGKLYDDKIVIEKNKFCYDRILSMNMEEQVNKNINKYCLIAAFFFLIMASFKINDVLFFYSYLFLCSVAVLLAIIYHSKEYILIFSFSIGDQLEFRAKSKNKEEAKAFLLLATQVKENRLEKVV